MRPLTGGEVQATTDLLTEVFATLGGPGWNVYTRYMRNQIRKFLEVRDDCWFSSILDGLMFALLGPER